LRSIEIMMRSKYVLVAIVAILAHGRAWAEVKVTRSDGTISVSNGLTRILVPERDGRATGFSVEDARSGRLVARVSLGGGGRWSAACKASAEKEAGVVTFSAISTSDTGNTPKPAADSFVRVVLSEGDAFPSISFRLVVTGFDPTAWEKALGCKVPVSFLECRLESARVFYLGGFVSPMPGLDGFSLKSPAMRGNWDGTWSYGPALGACPVPAVGLWDPDARTFAAYEFQHARSTDKSSKYVGCAVCAEWPGHGGCFFALLIPYQDGWTRLTYPRSGARLESRFKLIYSTDLPATGTPNEFVLRHIRTAYGDLLPPVPAMNDLGWMPKREAIPPDDYTTSDIVHRVRRSVGDPDGLFFSEARCCPRGIFSAR